MAERRGNIYFFTGQPGHGKSVLGKKLVEFLQTERRNWRKSVFYLDENNLREITLNKDYSEQGIINNIRNAQMIAEYLYNNDCDVVISSVAPYLWLREEFKERMGNNVIEIYVHTTQKREKDNLLVNDYQQPEDKFIDIDTTKDNPIQSFNKLIQKLQELKKL